ncbi:tenascin-N-like isoform X2 [Sardina pilchardus]|uniref:tenascin-N-like isoform X2 n=1 Tax=Sardina pilchardus TaxID=27697 RepID=UPI002E0D63A9
MKKSVSSGASDPSMRTDQSKDQSLDFSIKSLDSGHAPSVSSSGVSGEGICDVCSDTAVKICLTCMAFYCGTHVKDHYTSPDLERHQLQNLRCELHHKKLKLYCRADQSAICSRCLLHDHKGHDVIEQNPLETSLESTIRKDIPRPGEIQFTSVQTDSVSLRWSPPEGAPGPHRFRVTWGRGHKQHSMIVGGLDLTVTELIPGVKYNFAVATLSENGLQSSCVDGFVHTEVPPPENLTVDLSPLKASVEWTKPAGVDKASYLLELFRDQKRIDAITRDSPNYTIPGLQHGRDYTINVYIVLNNGCQSKPSSQRFRTEIPVPEGLTVMSITTSSVSLSWEVSPEINQTPHSFLVSYQSEGTEPQPISTESCSTDITGLKPGTEYTVRVYIQLKEGGKGQPASKMIKTEVPVPDNLAVGSVTASSANFSWEVPPEMNQTPHRFLVSYQSEGTELWSITTESCSADIKGLKPGTLYTVEVYTQGQHGGKSQPVSHKIKTEITAPRLAGSSVTETSASLRWEVSPEMKQTPHSFLVSYQSEGAEPQSISPKSCSAVISGLKPGTEYTVRIDTVLDQGRKSNSAPFKINTRPAGTCLLV